MVLWSTPESIERGEASWLAILETILAVAAYWGIAWAFDTHFHLLMSVLVAPLLLLRSPQSVALGVRWFESYFRSDKHHRFIHVLYNILLLVVIIILTKGILDAKHDIEIDADMLLFFITFTIISVRIVTLSIFCFIYGNISTLRLVNIFDVYMISVSLVLFGTIFF